MRWNGSPDKSNWQRHNLQWMRILEFYCQIMQTFPERASHSRSDNQLTINTDKEPHCSCPAPSVCVPVGVHSGRSLWNLVRGLVPLERTECGRRRACMVRTPLRTWSLLSGCLSSAGCVNTRRKAKNTVVGPKWITMISSVPIRTFDNKRGAQGLAHTNKEHSVVKGRKSQ